jgi:lipopolysaccharide export LptBFGC system permease protein LptF
MENTPKPNTPQDVTDIQSSSPIKKRHGCLTAWLVLIIIANVAVMIISVASISSNPSNYYVWAIPVEIIFGVWAVVCAIALFKWKKWGFWGFFIAAIILTIIYIIAGNYVYCITPFISVGILYAVLNIGKDNKGWPQLE